jgi:N-methylhydantoinase A
MWKQFHAVHDQTFGFNYEGEQDVEVVNLRVQAVGIQHRPALKEIASAAVPAAPFGSRQVYWRATGWVDCPLYDRTKLATGQHIEGPAIIEEYGSTVVVPASWSLRPDAYGNLILVKSA